MKKHLHALIVLFSCVMFTGLQQASAQAPVITSFSPAQGSIGALITIKGTNLNNPTSIQVGGVSAILISNTGTKLVVMVMPGTVTGNINISSPAGNAISSSNFSIINRSAGFKQQGDKLTSPSTQKLARIGTSVALSADGNTAVVGGVGETKSVGAIWIFVRQNETWVKQGKKLIGTGYKEPGDVEQGTSVAISADGNTVISGGPDDNGYFGAFWVFTRNSAGVWTQQGDKLVPTGATGATPSVGWAVALSADGNTAAACGWRDNAAAGAFWVFTRNGAGVWTQQGNKLFTTTTIAGLGFSLAISADGSTIATGAPYLDYANFTFSTGGTWVFTRDGAGKWNQQGDKLVGSGAEGSSVAQGYSVALSADGNTLLTGGFADNNYLGAAWVFVRNNDGVWTQQGNKLVGQVPVGPNYENEGRSVALSADGNTAVIGTETKNDGAWIFKRNESGVWTQVGGKIRGTGSAGDAYQGTATALSADGSTLIMGGPEDNHLIGDAWIFADTAYILPVNITKFKAYPLGKGIQTVWTGFDEINMKGYEVERSANGRQFTALGNIPAQGIAAAENNYTYFDAAPLQGDNFYRIKAISKDGSAQYSSIVKINIADTRTLVQVFPNPVSNKTINLQFSNLPAGNYSIAVYNALGQRVYNRGFAHNGNNTAVSIPLRGAAAGVYRVTVNGTQKKYSIEAVIE